MYRFTAMFVLADIQLVDCHRLSHVDVNEGYITTLSIQRQCNEELKDFKTFVFISIMKIFYVDSKRVNK